MRKKLIYLAAFLVYVSAILSIQWFESQSPDSNIKTIGDAFWYAIVTLTTVGYGDFYPVTLPGKIIGLLVIVGSLGILGFLIGEITVRFNQYMEKKKSGFWGTDFENHYVIIGWNEFAQKVANQIIHAGQKVAFVTNSKTDLDLIADLYSSKDVFSLFADYSNIEAYQKVNVSQSKRVFVNFESDSETLVFVINLKKQYPMANVVVRCANPSLKETFLNAGIDHVIAQNEVASKLVASYLFEPHVATYTEDLIATSVSDEDSDIQQYLITEECQFAGADYMDAFLKLKVDFNAILIGLVQDGKIIKNPVKGTNVQINNYLILISSGDSKKALEKFFGVKEGE
ncbi:potassium channel family protein [Marinifilum flexuosum]|uniref:BK channel n=1 Tax=Marinifilum flexuosum TaxID=1117708 RepID=A0A419WXH1_9BACT|nr:potassium channel family protein [Marinifilum flexuosum]RKE00160.1 voltage-gated potassium channel [Marinifilum flexuosum]